ncbi:UDP-glucuronic acid decarboxylase family protein [Halomonas llamarensis]|uniref:SDR family oxidoreductase n=1 Tax=Halomonas llamarensis TaxID=2945104 RepID=A0ABT0SQ68_9GAMM|nr:UDP-glucuronic acid decarboxylase family protein [Halomonas llamarensis]MCL7929600.1 SDR family oxidoreductase [Halomonas llamarensis]
MRRYLVTGGAGFVGSHLCDRLLDDGHAVLCIDNLVTGASHNVAHHADNAHFVFCYHDVVRPLGAGDVNGIDGIFHLACPASPAHYQQAPISTTQTAVVGTLNLLDMARAQGIPIVHASTSEVYGDPREHPQTEAYWGHVNPTGPRACYDEGKRCAESLCFDYHRQHGVAVKVARIFNTYGPRMQLDDGRVVSNFIRQALQGEPMTLYGDGQQTRSFCYVDDLVDGLVRLMNTPDDITGPMNLGNPGEVSMHYLAHLIGERMPARPPLRYLPLPTDDPRRRCPDIQRARKQLGWQPRISLEAGLNLTLNAFQKRLAHHLRASVLDHSPQPD